MISELKKARKLMELPNSKDKMKRTGEKDILLILLNVTLYTEQTHTVFVYMYVYIYVCNNAHRDTQWIVLMNRIDLLINCLQSISTTLLDNSLVCNFDNKTSYSIYNSHCY